MLTLIRGGATKGFSAKSVFCLNSVRFKAKKQEIASVFRYRYDLKTAYLREAIDVRDQPAITMTFKYINTIPPMDKTYNFWCDPELPLDEAIERMKRKIKSEMKIRYELSIANKFDEDKTKDWTDEAIKNFDLEIVNENGEQMNDFNWGDLMTDSNQISKLRLIISNQEYNVVFNGPYIAFIELPTTIMVGDDCYPSKINLENTTKEECTYKWYKGTIPEVNEKEVFEPIENLIEWKLCSNSFYYTVSPEDIGCKLKFECTPSRDNQTGPTLSVVSKCVVVEKFGNKFDAFKQRQELTKHRFPIDSEMFRVVSYNLLANFYNDARYSLAAFYPYCRAEALDIDYRKKLFIRELRGYNSDITCLQEVDSKVFHNDLKPMMDEDGLQGWHKRKGFMPEGVATFFNSKKFTMVWRGGFTIGEHLNSEPFLSDLYNKIKDNPALCNRILLLPTAVQVTLLKLNNQDKHILVVNTHLCAQLDAAHIRLLQLQSILLYVKRIYDNELKALNVPADQVSVVFSGDFNSKPEEGVFKLITEKFIPNDYQDFRSNEDQTVTNISLSHDFNLASAYDPPPIYTNYTGEFKGCLDYIFHDKENLKVIQTVPVPDEEVLTMETALPSIYFPSDHIALIADFEWTKK